MAIRFIWPFQNGHGHFEMAKGSKTASNALLSRISFSVEINITSLIDLFDYSIFKDFHLVWSMFSS